MTFKYLDASQSTLKKKSLIDCMKRNGIAAVGRYYTRPRTAAKILTAPEAAALSAAGIDIWAVYQIYQNEASYFSRAKGQAAGKDALDYAQNVIGQPKGSGIYFAVDFDASQAEFELAVKPYFQAVKEEFAAAGTPYRIGAYGSGLVCEGLLDEGLVQLTWVSQSKGFRGTRAFLASGKWNLNQGLGVKKFCGFDDEIDPDDVNPQKPDYGRFTLGAPAVVAEAAAAPPAGVSAAALTATVFPGVTPYPGSPVRRGETGSNTVKLVQSRLNDLTYGPLVADGDFGEATENAVFHFQARNATAAGTPLDITGEADEPTWGILFGPGAIYSASSFNASLPLRQLVIDIAASQIGVVEQPRGSNCGPEVDQYIRSVGLNPAEDSFPWCVCFCHWVFDQAAKLKHIENPLPMTAGVHVLWNKGQQTAALVVKPSEASAKTVKPGMIFMIDTGGGHGHAGLVAGVSGNHLITIEGNTNQGGSADGYGVFRREARPIAMGRLLGYLDFCDIDVPVA